MLSRLVSRDTILAHFTARAPTYDASSQWARDERLAATAFEALAPRPQDKVLDLACGTGLVARRFHGRVALVVGVDITPAMFRHCRPHVDRLVVAAGEALPFADRCFDLAIERQGIQFMDAAAAVGEMVRVTRPGGQVCLQQLCAYDEADRDEYFAILRLRNPARRNFFVSGDLAALLRAAGCREASELHLDSQEDVGCWADNGAIGGEAQAEIARRYAQASPGFLGHHRVYQEAGRIIDRMRFSIAIGRR